MTGQIVRAIPWWEIPPENEILEQDVVQVAVKKGVKDDAFPDRQMKVGFLVQIGWLLENEHGVWLGVGPGAQEMFDVVEQTEASAEESAK